MPVEITFIRHGQTEGNAAGRWQGHTNSSLTPLGQRQAAALGERFRTDDFDLIIASDLDRTVQTAQALDRPIETDPRWREPFFGSWEDKTTEEIAADGSGGLAALMAGEDVALGGGERLSEVLARATEALDDVVARVGNGSVAIVSHGMTLLTLVSSLLGTRRPSPLRLLGNTSTARLIVSEGRMWLPSYNDDTHLGHTEMPHYGSHPDDTEVVLVRHGQTLSNVEGRWQGHQDGQLNEVGRRQAKLVAAHLPAVDALYASPLSRAADTAGAIAAAQELEVSYDDRLKEIHFGEWEGLTTEEISSQFPESAAFFSGKDVVRGRTGETWVEVRERMRAALADIADRHRGGSVAVVSHGGVTRAWVTEVLGLSYERRNLLSILANTGYARIYFGRRGPSVFSWNLTPHLEGA